MLATDVALDIFKYHVSPFSLDLVVNYLVYAVIIGLGNWFGARAAYYKLILGGLLGATIFYLVTNTLSWLQDPYYAKTIAGWIQALFTGLPGYPPSWEFFRNTMMSGGLFTALFAGAMKLMDAFVPAEEKDEEEAPAEEPDAKPEEAKA